MLDWQVVSGAEYERLWVRLVGGSALFEILHLCTVQSDTHNKESSTITRRAMPPRVGVWGCVQC